MTASQEEKKKENSNYIECVLRLEGGFKQRRATLLPKHRASKVYKTSLSTPVSRENSSLSVIIAAARENVPLNSPRRSLFLPVLCYVLVRGA